MQPYICRVSTPGAREAKECAETVSGELGEISKGKERKGVRACSFLSVYLRGRKHGFRWIDELISHHQSILSKYIHLHFAY